MKPAALKTRPSSADVKRRPAPATSREWDSTVNDMSEYRLSEKQLQAKVQARHASSKVRRFMRFLFFVACAACCRGLFFNSPQIDYNPLAELQKWEEVQRKEDASFASAGRRCCIDAIFCCAINTHNVLVFLHFTRIAWSALYACSR